MSTSGKPLHIDIPVTLKDVKTVFSIGALAFEGDLPASIFHMQLIKNDIAGWSATSEIIAVFHTNAGHVTLHDTAYNADRNIATGGRTMPDDLRRLLNLRWRDAASGRSDNLLKDAGVTFLDGGRMPRLIAAVCTGRDDLEGAARLAYAQAMGDMVRYSGFVAEDAAGDAIGYWFSSDRIPIETAPLLRFDTDGNFSILPGNGIAEAILVIASRDNNLTFPKLRDYLNEQGLNITARTIQDVQRRECSLLPQATYQRLIRADLLATSVSDTGGSVNIMTIHRGPKIGPETD